MIGFNEDNTLMKSTIYTIFSITDSYNFHSNQPLYLQISVIRIRWMIKPSNYKWKKMDTLATTKCCMKQDT